MPEMPTNAAGWRIEPPVSVPVAAGHSRAATAAALPPELPAGEQPTAAKNETRLRKLHLVRPDLIPYPIAFEVYC